MAIEERGLRKPHGDGAPAVDSVPGVEDGEASLLDVLHAAGVPGEECSGEVLRPSRYRPVYRYEVSEPGANGGGATRIFIGKADHRSGGAATFAYMRKLWRAGLRGDDGFAVPEPVAYLPDLALLLQTEAPGVCLYDHITAPDRALGAAGAAGRFLARLHGLDLRGARRLPPAYEETKLATYRDGLTGAVPAEAGRWAAVTDAVLDELAPLEAGPLVPTHGDYQPKNVYVTGDGEAVTVIDWDRGALASPGRDLGHFLGQCLTMAWVKTGTFATVRAWNDAFLHGYADGAPPGWEASVTPFVNRTILEVLYYKLVVKPARDTSFVGPWLAEMERSLSA